MNHMIQLYALSYLLTDYIKQSLTSIVENASEQVEITVIDNKSEESTKIFEFIKPLIDSGKVKRYIQLKENVQIMAFNQALELFPPNRSERFFMLTELDLIVKHDWTKEIRRVMSDPRVSIAGSRLSLENYRHPNGGHVDDGVSCGFWMMALDVQHFNQYMPLHIALSDEKVRYYMTSRGNRIAKQSPLCIYHLGWDTHKDYPEYFKRKVAIAQGKEKWNIHNRSRVEFIYEK